MSKTITDLIEITLTDFVDYVALAGGKKQTKVVQIKKRDDYGPEKDFYRKLRERIEDLHKGDHTSDFLHELLESDLHEHKANNFPELIDGYLKWINKKDIIWIGPPKAIWSYEQLRVKMNPELGLLINDLPHIIKLHFKKEPELTTDKVCMICNLLEEKFPQHAEAGFEFGVLDVRRSKLFKKDKRKSNLKALLKGEARSFITIWEEVF
ncbi:MAG: hypothetical protein H7329_13410 [Opitutaceae bacterium]|nr:hypothetical protein [Cytophagales bacterium]